MHQSFITHRYNSINSSGANHLICSGEIVDVDWVITFWHRSHDSEQTITCPVLLLSKLSLILRINLDLCVVASYIML